MAEDPTVNHYGGDGGGSIKEVTWALTTANPTGTAMGFPEWADRTWSVFGNFGATANVDIQGAANDVDAQFTILTEPDASTALTFAATASKGVLEMTAFMRPELDPIGTAAVLTVTCIARRQHAGWD